MHCSHNVEVLVPSHFREKVVHLCQQIERVEWSGVLFYRTLGEFGTPGFRCLLEDVLLMDIGDKTKTKYGAAGINCFLEENPVLRTAKKGHIHSHHTMTVFFSPDDERELTRNTQSHCYYLSVIVNNAGDMIAKLCYMADSHESQSQVLTVRLAPGRHQEIPVIDKTSQKRLLCYHECQLIHYNTGIGDGFLRRIKDVSIEKGYKRKWRGKAVISAPIESTGEELEMSQLGIFGDKTIVTTKTKRKSPAKTPQRGKGAKKPKSPGGEVTKTKRTKK